MMAFIKEESEDVMTEETFRVKQEDTEDQTKMMFIKEEIENVKIEEVFSLKQEDTEEQTDLMPLKEESQDPSDMEENYQYEKPHQFMIGEKYFSDSKIEKMSSQNKGTRKIEGHMKVQTGESPFTCQQCVRSFSHKKTLNRHMKIHTGMKHLHLPTRVEEVSVTNKPLTGTRKFTPELSFSPANSVEEVSVTNKPLTGTMKFTPERSRSPANSVERDSLIEETWKPT
ncbi:gastrula zinc finger protein xFG20-1-like [Cyprinus carpio]|uniref:Gastrula zinc finger protein xFG20-1-like n=1 Tax=Cyprinus carpio TaxID=7962 RepID=A0A9Q9XYP8_CYPCA|nr:gastrula zinc finger protein xFG20-1-like [Cyprinus carpio]